MKKSCNWRDQFKKKSQNQQKVKKKNLSKKKKEKEKKRRKNSIFMNIHGQSQLAIKIYHNGSSN